MRTPALLGALCLLPACTSMVMAEPRLLVSPYMAVYQLRGDIGVQSEPTPGTLQNNAPQTMRTFGQDHHREDVGVRVDFGDDFGGVRFDYYRLDQNTAAAGVLEADFGTLLQGDVVRMNVTMDEFRVGYLEPILNLKATWRDHPLDVRFALGALVAHRQMDLRASTTDGQRRQDVEIQGDVVYPAVRARVGWRDATLDIEYAISPELALGGDFEGTLHDLEVRASYTLPMRDLTLFAGYRYSELPAEGREGNFAWDADLKIDGFQFGFVLTF